MPPSSVLLEASRKGTPFEVTAVLITPRRLISFFAANFIRAIIFLPRKKGAISNDGVDSSDICLVYGSAAARTRMSKIRRTVDGHVVLVNKGVWSYRWQEMSLVGYFCG